MSESAHKLTPFEGGATRSSKEHRFDLIPRDSLEALARRLAHGADIHGEHNWKAGGVAFRRATVNHLLAHVYDYIINGNSHDANTDAIIANAAFLSYFEAEDIRHHDQNMLERTRPAEPVSAIVRINADNGHEVLLTPLEQGTFDVSVVDVKKLPNGKLHVTFASNGVEMSETFTPVKKMRAAKVATKRVVKKAAKRK